MKIGWEPQLATAFRCPTVLHILEGRPVDAGGHSKSFEFSQTNLRRDDVNCAKSILLIKRLLNVTWLNFETFALLGSSLPKPGRLPVEVLSVVASWRFQ